LTISRRGIILRRFIGLLTVFLAGAALAQTPPSGAAQPQKAADGAVVSKAEIVPDRILHFAQVETDPALSISAVTSLPQCGSDGTLFLDMLDPKDLRKHTVVSIRGKKSQTYLPSAISDLHDITVFSFFPSDSMVAFLVRGTKEMQGTPGAGKSPAGYAWSGYHSYIAEFDRDGGYKASVEIPANYQISRLAILPSREFLVAGYDQLNSTARLLLLGSSGDVLRSLDMPASRVPAATTGPHDAVEASKASRALIGNLVFTPYGQDILVWRKGSADPILDVGPGGSVREVPLEPPSGYVFVDMVPANDRWVAHFRLQDAVPDSPFNQKSYAYYDLRPQDASLSAKLLISGELPQFLACESDGSYLTYKLDKDGKMILFRTN